MNNDLIDLAIVLTPSGTHYKIVKKFLKAKINVLCEKPLTLLPKENINLSKLANKNKVILSVAFQNRLNPAVVFLKNNIDKKKFGKMVKASVSLFGVDIKIIIMMIGMVHGKWMVVLSINKLFIILIYLDGYLVQSKKCSVI